MKLLGLMSIFLAAIVSFTACSNELDLTAPWKDVPVVYGMLSVSDTAQYIRVERAFLDPKENALNFTSNPDSIYYSNATVSLVHLASGAQHTLTKVDGNAEGYVRDTGIWAQAPNYLYKIKTADLNLIQGDEYQLVISKGDNQPETKAQTQVVELSQITRPSISQKVSFSFSDYVLNWKKAEGAEIYDIDVIFNYKESLESNPAEFVDKSIKWKALSGVNASSTSTFIEVHSISGLEFYTWLGSTIPQKNVNRIFVDIGFIVTAGGKELNQYFTVSQANFGITGSETTTDYTNIPDGFGIFSSLSKATVSGLEISGATLDSLRNGHYTKGLNFQ